MLKKLENAESDDVNTTKKICSMSHDNKLVAHKTATMLHCFPTAAICPKFLYNFSYNPIISQQPLSSGKWEITLSLPCSKHYVCLNCKYCKAGLHFATPSKSIFSSHPRGDLFFLLSPWLCKLSIHTIISDNSRETE